MKLDDLLARLVALPDEDRAAVTRDALGATKSLRWVPNPGPQTDAYFSEADELLYGGEAGGGKTDLLIGLSLAEHDRSLILRRVNKDAVKLVSRFAELLGSRGGYNGQHQAWQLADQRIDIAGCEHEDDKQRFKGDPHDLIGFDELADFLESQYTFIIGWNRSTNPNQRCRVVAATNPPTKADGLWIIRRWRAWLDDQHPKPAKFGELRWYLTINGEDTELDGVGPHLVNGKMERALSRTFIPASLDDNPDLARTNYSAVLAGLPEELRRAYKEGDWSVGQRDSEFQVIPTAWIIDAQQRWKPDGYKAFAMTAMAFDPAGGGNDAAELCWRHGGWYAPLLSEKGEQTADGSAAAAKIISHRRDKAPVVVDAGGGAGNGFGGTTLMRLADNGIPCLAFNGANSSHAKTQDGSMNFANKRAEAWWKFREALDPDQEGGCDIALPPDAELRSDLAAPTYDAGAKGILVESKIHLRKRLGRSPGKGDAVVMCWSDGNKAVKRALRKGVVQVEGVSGYRPHDGV